MNNLYNTIFKRKSIRKYNEHYLKDEDLNQIRQYLTNLNPLIENIKIDYKIVKKEETTSRFGQYCLLFYSETKENYLLNAGYLLEQVDLYLESNNIGVCWCGLGKTEEQNYNGLDFVIMLAFGNTDEEFRNDNNEFKRKELNEIWNGDFSLEIKNAFRLAPSSCNTQPWFIKSDGKIINLFQNKNVKAFVSDELLAYSNKIDLGISMLFLELSLKKNGYQFSREIKYNENSDQQLIEVVEYKIDNNKSNLR